MRVVVLEPDGNHWTVELEKPGEPFSAAEKVPLDEAKSRRVHGDRFSYPMPEYRVVHYMGYEFRDVAGNTYWIYARA